MVNATQVTNDGMNIEVVNQMAKIEPFLQLNPDKTVVFNHFSAQLKLDKETLKTGKIYERLHNSVISAVSEDRPAFQSQQDKEDLKLFEPFFKMVQESGALTTQELLNTLNKDNVTVVPKNKLTKQIPKVVSLSSKSKQQTLSLACSGGSIPSPAYCPAWQFPTNQYTSAAAAGNALLQMGYHSTYAPGCGWEYPCTVDYSKWLSVNGCNYGVFRNQAITFQSGTKWKIRFQSPEPNPEVLSYNWPATWWGTYVVYWHQVWPQPSGKLGC